MSNNLILNSKDSTLSCILTNPYSKLFDGLTRIYAFISFKIHVKFVISIISIKSTIF